MFVSLLFYSLDVAPWLVQMFPQGFTHVVLSEAGLGVIKLVLGHRHNVPHRLPQRVIHGRVLGRGRMIGRGRGLIGRGRGGIVGRGLGRGLIGRSRVLGLLGRGLIGRGHICVLSECDSM